MKNFLKVFAIILFLGTTTQLFAQKFGHVDSQGILSLMPETKAAKDAMEKEKKTLEDQLEIMQVEYNNKVEAYFQDDQKPANDATKWSAMIKKDKESELKGLQQRIQEFQMSADEALQTKQMELLKPITEKLNSSIKKIAETNDFTYVFDINSVLYYSPTKSIDITPMLKKELGLK